MIRLSPGKPGCKRSRCFGRRIFLMNRKVLFLTFVLLLVGVFSACAGNAYVAVRTAPPPPRALGVVGYAPGPGHVWVDGFWDWRGGDLDLVGGFLGPAARAAAVSVGPRWGAYRRVHRFHLRYWER